MTTTTSTAANLRTRQASPSSPIRRMATALGSLLAGVGARWSAIVDTGQLGPDAERDLSRWTGGRI